MKNQRFWFGFLGFLGFLGFNDPWYFFFFLFFLFFVPAPKPAAEGGGNMPDLMQKQAENKLENLNKIKEFVKDKEKIVNDDIQKLLGVSDATATRYLDELEKQGFLRQKGKKKGVYYEKKW